MYFFLHLLFLLHFFSVHQKIDVEIHGAMHPIVLQFAVAFKVPCGLSHSSSILFQRWDSWQALYLLVHYT
jgi:hypothetical protein